MTNPISKISEVVYEYLWPVEPQPEIKAEVKDTDKKVEEVAKEIKPAEPSWAKVASKGNPYAGDRSME